MAQFSEDVRAPSGPSHGMSHPCTSMLPYMFKWNYYHAMDIVNNQPLTPMHHDVSKVSKFIPTANFIQCHSIHMISVLIYSLDIDSIFIHQRPNGVD